MPRWADTGDEGDWDTGADSEADDLGPSEDEDDEIPCPYCGREIHEDSVRCPYCESYISKEDAPPARKPWWIILGVVACLYVVFRWIVWM
jgi:DNA-directed RNA polymerase subunit RPC12/RpoP